MKRTIYVINELMLCILIIYFCMAQSAIAKTDRELLESQKCTKYFSFFEKKHKIPPNTLHSISLKESGRKHSQHQIRIVWPWTVNVEGQGYFFDNKFQAVKFTKEQLALGKESIDVGCMQINMKHHPYAFTSIEKAFEPSHNVSYAAEFLRTKYDQHNNWHKAIASYHSCTEELGSKYKQNVIKISQNMREYKASLRQLTKTNIKYENTYYPDPYETIQNSGKNKLALNNERIRSNIMVRIPQKQSM